MAHGAPGGRAAGCRSPGPGGFAPAPCSRPRTHRRRCTGGLLRRPGPLRRGPPAAAARRPECLRALGCSAVPTSARRCGRPGPPRSPSAGPGTAACRRRHGSRPPGCRWLPRAGAGSAPVYRRSPAPRWHTDRPHPQAPVRAVSARRAGASPRSPPAVLVYPRASDHESASAHETCFSEYPPYAKIDPDVVEGADVSSCCAPMRDEGSAKQPAAVGAAAVQPARDGESAQRHTIEQRVVPAQTFRMGDSDGVGYPADGETPVHEVRISEFSIDATSVTNADFARFVAETGYRTEAELFGFSAVFHLAVAAPKEAIMGPASGKIGRASCRDSGWRTV